MDDCPTCQAILVSHKTGQVLRDPDGLARKCGLPAEHFYILLYDPAAKSLSARCQDHKIPDHRTRTVRRLTRQEYLVAQVMLA